MLSKLSAELHRATEKCKEIEATKQSERETEEDLRFQITTTARELELFLQSEEGGAAMEFLAVSKQHINFGEERMGHGMGEVFFIDGSGLNLSVEGMGMWMAYSKDVPKPEITPISALEAIDAAVRYSGIKPSEILVKLKDKLTEMAASAPNRSHPGL